MSREQWLAFEAGGTELLGILCPGMPNQAPALGVLIVVGGPQYRVGAHRHFVLLARQLAHAGYPTLRFDHRGVGDSLGPAPNFEALDEDIAAAITAFFAAQPSLNGVVIWGLCDAASAALLYVRRRGDTRVRGLALLNPWVRSPRGQAQVRVRHYYSARLRDPAFWRKLLHGGVALGAVTEWWHTRRQARKGAASQASNTGGAYQELMAQAWQNFRGPVLLQLSGRDHTAREFEAVAESFPVWRDWTKRPLLTMQSYPDADHTFSDRHQRDQSTSALLTWLHSIWSPS